MNKELELWQFVAERLEQNKSVMLLVVAESSGSSPGRQGYKMAVDADGELCGSIGGGVMEVNLVERAKQILSEPPASMIDSGSPPYKGGVAAFRRRGGSFFVPQIHQKHSQNASGMICSGEQTVIFKLIVPNDLDSVKNIFESFEHRHRDILKIETNSFSVGPPKGGTPKASETQNADFVFEKKNETDFLFEEKLGVENDLYIVGGGHCALALSELMSKMDFYIRLFDDRPDLNTLDKNRFADEKHIIESYEQIGDLIRSGSRSYVVVMTLGYKSDEAVIRRLLDKDFKYFGVLGSKAKMATLMKSLKKEGLPANRLDKIRTPIGLPINSRTPEEIAVSIAAEIIAVKNS